MQPDPKAAFDMLAAFAGVGVSRFDVTLTNQAGEKTGYRPGRSIEALRQIIPPMLAETTRQQQNLIVRPHRPDSADLVQLDDLNEAAAAKVAPFAFMVLLTSPGNYQAWIALKDAPQDFARRLRKGAGADPTASGATRISGSFNFKTKYAPHFPPVAITQTRPGKFTTADELHQAGLVAAAEQPTPPRVSHRVSSGRTSGRRRSWPSWQRCVEGAPMAHGEDRPDISRADFVFAMTALDWGWSKAETKDRLMDVSSKARENGEKYAIATVENAAEAVQRRQGLKPHPEPR